MVENLIGYNGKIAYINLKEKKVDIVDLDPKLAEEYLGGTGISAKITYDMLSPEDYEALKDNPFSGINPLIFATGPVTGTLRPSSGRYSVTAISPLTGIWGEGTSGGKFCISLRNSGFDAFVITQRAENPTYLYIHDNKIEFKDASKYWGKDTYETQEEIKADLNNEQINIATIGIAGENLVKYACIINDEGRAVGRCGLGAIMGSKNLKAIAAIGSKRVSIADSQKSKELLKEAEQEKLGDFLKTAVPQVFALYGTNSYLDIGMALGDTPGYYFTKSEFLAEKLTGKTLREEYPVIDYGCAGCTLKCGKITVVEDDGKDIKVDGPEYETVAAYGPMLGIFDSKEVILAHHYCNMYGIDTISSGVSISFLIYLVENQLGLENIKKLLKELKIEDLHWGNRNLIPKIIELISRREGIGDLLAEGVRIMAERLEVDPELAVHVKGLEVPMHDPRAFFGQGLSYMTCCVGANHEKCDWFSAEIGNLAYPRLRIKAGDRDSIKGRERGVKALQDIRAIDDSGVNCNFRNPSLDHIIGHINAATGAKHKKKSLMLLGERINTIKRLISCNLGITREDDKLPGHIQKVLDSGKTAGLKIDLEKNLKRYYKERGWDWETGRPTQDKLQELNII
ncbi:MAG: aldehyde ferredoxin oxidoreductase [Candidatus Lokiarchaeota archaeon]|nr:aldehyde ferredoxin oxidoreductase [Candidatus Lokiarchaeota archaeon]MBD3343007.1 aldehyde ferredoxin oxidoreductase [Candidatus Lokiarchaeota archaeon]